MMAMGRAELDGNVSATEAHQLVRQVESRKEMKGR